VGEGLPGELEHHPLLRVEVLGLARGDAEEVGVEALDVVHERAQPGGPAQDGGRPRAARGVGLPALGRHLADRAAAFGQESPELVERVEVRGETAAHTDDGHRFRVLGFLTHVPHHLPISEHRTAANG